MFYACIGRLPCPLFRSPHPRANYVSCAPHSENSSIDFHLISTCFPSSRDGKTIVVHSKQWRWCASPSPRARIVELFLLPACRLPFRDACWLVSPSLDRMRAALYPKEPFKGLHDLLRVFSTVQLGADSARRIDTSSRSALAERPGQSVGKEENLAWHMDNIAGRFDRLTVVGQAREDVLPGHPQDAWGRVCRPGNLHGH